MYGLVSSPKIPHQDELEYFVLNENVSTKSNLDPMAKEFKPSLGGYFPQNDFASVASKPVKMSTSTRTVAEKFTPIGNSLQNDFASMASKPAKMFNQKVQHSARLSADDRLLQNISDVLKKDKLLILMRGCPGSGKSTLANKIMEYFKHKKICTILSTDDFFKSGKHYKYDSAKLPEAHSWNKDKAFTAMKEKNDLIIIDNTNVSKWEMSPYAKMAVESHYKVMLVEPNTKWKFSAWKLAKINSHSVSVQKIKDMLSRYEKKVTVEQLLKLKMTQETKTTEPEPEPERNIAKPEMKSHPKTKMFGRDGNNNRNHYFPSETTKNHQDDIFTEDKMSPVCAADFEESNNQDSWGSDEWYEPQDQRRPKENFSDMKNDFSDEESSSADADFEQQVLQIYQSINNEKPEVKSLSALTLTCLEKFNNDEICERASLATVRGCQMKNEILLDCFQRNSVKTFLPPNFTGSSNEENSACSIESLRSSTSEDSLDVSSEEHNDFYLLLSLDSNFLHLLTHIFGPINNLNIEKMNPDKNVDIKLNYDHMECFHKALTEICAPNNETSKEMKEKSHNKINRSVESPASTKNSTVVSMYQIMKEQTESEFELKHKLEHSDKANIEKLKILCSKFPSHDPNILENILSAKDYNLSETFAVLNVQPQQDSVDYRCHSNIRTMPSRNNNTSVKTSNKLCLNWLNVSRNDEREQYEFYSARLEENIKQRKYYQDARHYAVVVSYFSKEIARLSRMVKDIKIRWLKQELASSLTYKSYNKIDLHGLTKREARYLVIECLEDYSEALKTYTSMKKHLILITGRGTNSVNKKSILKPHIISYLRNRHSYDDEGGSLKVYC